MKLMPTTNNNQLGFSLVELMIVVAVIGILSAIAVPRFAGFQETARKSEAKSNLPMAAKLFELQNAQTGSYITNDGTTVVAQGTSVCTAAPGTAGAVTTDSWASAAEGIDFDPGCATTNLRYAYANNEEIEAGVFDLRAVSASGVACSGSQSAYRIAQDAPLAECTGGNCQVAGNDDGCGF